MENELFTSTKISKAYIKISLPLVFSLVVSLIYNLADTFFVAQTNDTNLVAGVSLGVPIFTFLMALGNILGLGGSSLISRLLGQNDSKNIRHVSSFCYFITLIAGIVVCAIMLAFRVPILYLIGANEGTFYHASNYYIYLSFGAPLIMASFVHSNALRSEGMSTESMIGSIGGAVVNIILDPILISVLGMGASGAAIATVTGYIFTDIYYFVVIWRKSRILSLNIKELKVPVRYITQIFGIGVPSAISNIMQSVSIILINQFLLPYGNDKIAAMGIVLKVNMIILLILTGFTFGGLPLFGYYYGANDKKRLSELLRFCVKFISTLAVVLTVAIFFAAPTLMGCFMNNPQIISDGTVMLRWQSITMLFVGFILLMTIVFQSTGKIFASFLLSLSRQGVVFAIALFVAVQFFGYTGILASQAIADLITALLAIILFYKQLYKELF